MMNTLSIMCGFPGCGKSTFLKEKADEGVILSPDDFRLILTGQVYYAPAEDSVWCHVKTAARVLLKKGYSVIIDATHLTVGRRAQWVDIARESDVPIVCWHVDVPFDVCKERNRNRSAVVPDDVMDRMYEQFVVPTEEEGLIVKRMEW